MKIMLAFKKSVPDDTEWYWKIAAKLVKFGTRSQYFHVEMAINNKWISANTSRGIELFELTELHNDHYDYYELDVDELTDIQYKKFWKYIESQSGSGYDWMGIFLTQFINLDWESKSKWFCSEIVTKILQLLYVEEFLDCKPNRISPREIFDVVKSSGKQIFIACDEKHLSL